MSGIWGVEGTMLKDCNMPLYWLKSGSEGVGLRDLKIVFYKTLKVKKDLRLT